MPKKQFPEEGGETTSQAGMHSCKNSTVLPADSERRWNFYPTDDNIAASKPKQNLPDRSSNRHALPGMKKTSSLNM